jgi:hypothetical protein
MEALTEGALLLSRLESNQSARLYAECPGDGYRSPPETALR